MKMKDGDVFGWIINNKHYSITKSVGYMLDMDGEPIEGKQSIYGSYSSALEALLNHLDNGPVPGGCCGDEG